MSIIINVTPEEVLKGKFSNTISKIEGCLKEARGLNLANVGYDAVSVVSRMNSIKEAFYLDIKNLSENIEITK